MSFITFLQYVLIIGRVYSVIYTLYKRDIVRNFILMNNNVKN